jgi:hypothetical protein
MKPIKIIQGLSAALAVHASTEPRLLFKQNAPANISEPAKVVSASGNATSVACVPAAAWNAQSSTKVDRFSIRFADGQNWTIKASRRYRALVVRESLGQLTAAETDELDKLQALKRCHFNPPTGDEILFRYKRQKLDEGMIELLERYVGNGPKPASCTQG